MKDDRLNLINSAPCRNTGNHHTAPGSQFPHRAERCLKINLPASGNRVKRDKSAFTGKHPVFHGKIHCRQFLQIEIIIETHFQNKTANLL